jgi:heat shock protein HslJ
MASATRPRPVVRSLFVLLALAASLVLAACGSASATPKPTFGPVTLEGTDWRLISYMSPTGTNYTVPMSVTPTAKFAGGQFSGFAGCNTFSGPFTQDGDTVKIGPLAGTQMACQEPLLGVELAYTQALAAVNTAAAAGDTMRLVEKGGFSALEFVRAK